MPKAPDVLTTAQACEALGGLDRSTLIRWVQIGKIKPAMKLGGQTGAYLFRRRDVEALAAELDKRQGDGAVAVAEHGP